MSPTRVLRACAVVLAAAYTLLYVALALLRLHYPFELEWLEGGGLDEVRRLAQGQPIYVRPTIDYIAYPYTPLYFYLSAWVSALVNDVSFFPMRLVSFAASIGMLALIVAIVRKETGQWHWAAISCGLMCATYGLSDGWFDVGRVDSLFLALVLAGVYGIQLATPRSLLAAGLCLALAFLTKQTAILIALPMMAIVAIRQPRQSVLLIGPAIALLGIATIYFQVSSGGWFWYYIFDLQRTAGAFSATRAINFWVRDLLPQLAIAGGVVVVFLASASWLSASRSRLYLSVGTVTMFVVSWAARSRSGNYVNSLMPAYAAIAILFGLAMADLEQLLVTLEARLRTRFHVMLYVLSAIQLSVLAFNPFSEVPTAADEMAGREVVARLATIDGNVFIPCHAYLGAMAGKRTYAHIQEVLDVTHSVRAELADEITSTLHDHFQQLAFAAVLPCEHLRDLVDTSGLTAFYTRKEALFEAADHRFTTVAGVPSRPEEVYVPK